jgi:hypothetical protein
MRGTLFTLLLLAAGMLSISAQEYINELSPDEERDGYDLLFNGSDLDLWKSYQTDRPPNSWVINQQDGYDIIEVVPGEHGHIFTIDDTYLNFDLKIEWSVPDYGNSGIFIRYLESEGAWAGNSGPEAQVVDISHSDGQQAKHQAGVCYDMIPLDESAQEWWNPTGEWNEFRIIAFYERVAHYGNGIKLLEYEIGSSTWQEAYAASKYRNIPMYGDIHEGAIYIQHHGETGIKYRNVRVKRLTDEQDPWDASSPHLGASGLIEEMTLLDNLFPEAPGCPDENYLEYDPDRTSDDPSLCLTEKVPGCPDTSYVEYNADRNVDDSSLCQTLKSSNIARELGNPGIKIEFAPGLMTVVLPVQDSYLIILQDIHGKTAGTFSSESKGNVSISTERFTPGVYIINILIGNRSLTNRLITVR